MATTRTSRRPPPRRLRTPPIGTIRTRILDNVWPPGYRALEQELALALGMSRTPVREALMRLAKEGLVEVRSRHGMRVLPVSADDMRDIYQVLTALESTAVELVARRRPDAKELEPLVEASRDMARALKADDLDAWAAADERFHRHLVELCGQPLAGRRGAELLGPRAPRAHGDAAHASQARQLDPRAHRRARARSAQATRAAAFDAHRAHRERGSRELLAILERYRLQQL